APPGLQPAPVFGEQAVNPRKTKRQAWYGGPIAAPSGGSQPIYISQRTSPDDSGSSEEFLHLQLPRAESCIRSFFIRME
ncbi:Up in starvation, partial [Taxawa tesnikishii (nom. ined.)]